MTLYERKLLPFYHQTQILTHMKTLIIPDIHHHIDGIEELIAKEKADEVIFLGDYFDDWDDTPEISARTARWLKHSLGQDNRVHLIGNHDMPYMYPYPDTMCPGYEPGKAEAINQVLTCKDWDKLKLCHFSQDFLYSHAGASLYHFEHPIKGISYHSIQHLCKKAMEELEGGIVNRCIKAGRSRGYSELIGGITWQDWDELEPIPGINQVVGHTPCAVPLDKIDSNSINVCLDTNCNHYGIIQDGRLSTAER